MPTYFSDRFGVSKKDLDKHGAFDVSIVTDLPMFIDPFLLFHSRKPEYKSLHEGIVKYLIFLREQAASGNIHDGLLRSWYCFPEVRQLWLGFSKSGNAGSGLGIDFARALHRNLGTLFADLGSEKITKGTHLEKVCLIQEGVGRDNISDFISNLIKEYLCQFTETFAKRHIDPSSLREVWIDNCAFNFDTEVWERRQYTLPFADSDYVLLSPKDMLPRGARGNELRRILRAQGTPQHLLHHILPSGIAALAKNKPFSNEFGPISRPLTGLIFLLAVFEHAAGVAK